MTEINTALNTVLTDIFERRAENRIADAEAERALISKAQSGDHDATVALLYAYASVLRKSVKGFTASHAASGQSADFDDIRMSAVLGFMEAIKKFDPAKQNRLASTVSEYVNGQVSEAAGSAAQFNVPARSLKRFFSIMRTADGNVYEAARIAPDFDMKRETFFAILSAVRDVESYDVPAGDDNEASAFANMDVTALYGRVKTSEQIVEDAILVAAAFEAIDEQETDVVNLAYGFSEYEPVSDAEIAHRMGLSRPKVQRVRSGALGKMRKALGVA